MALLWFDGSTATAAAVAAAELLELLVVLEFGEIGLVVNELDPLEKLFSCCCSFGVGGTFRWPVT